MTEYNGSPDGTKECGPFCTEIIPIEQDGCRQHDGQDARARDEIEAKAAGVEASLAADTSSFESFTAGMTDEDRRISKRLVQNMVITDLAKREKNRILNPPTGWADLKSIRSMGRPKRNPPTVMPYWVDNPFETEHEEVGLFYPAAINTVFGDAEVGKSLLNYAIHAHEINKGNHTVHMDFDNNTATEAFWRVVDSGADPDDVERLFHVVEMPSSVPVYDFIPTYVSLDCVNSAIAFMGGELNSSGTGVDQAYQTYLSPFVLQGACALALDHVNKSDKSQASNTIRKIQAISGISYRMEVHGSGGKIGEKWGSTLTPTKDRPGAGPSKEQVAAYIQFDGTVGEGLCEVTVMREPKNGFDTVIPDDITDADERLIYSIVSEVFDGALTVSDIEKEYQGKGGKAVRKTIMRILRRLREDEKIGGKQVSPSNPASAWKYWAAIPSEGDETV